MFFDLKRLILTLFSGKQLGPDEQGSKLRVSSLSIFSGFKAFLFSPCDFFYCKSIILIFFNKSKFLRYIHIQCLQLVFKRVNQKEEIKSNSKLKNIIKRVAHVEKTQDSK